MRCARNCRAEDLAFALSISKRTLLVVVGVLIYGFSPAQSIKIGAIDVFGNRKVRTDVILAQLPLKEGDCVTHESLQPEATARELERIPGVRHATVNPICCDTAGNLLLYIGIGESDSVLLKHRAAPRQNIRLPDSLLATYHAFGKQVEAAVQKGQNTEDDRQGYALLNYPPAREEQMRFAGFARRYFPLLEAVLKWSRYPEQRAAAAEIIAYSTNRKQVVADLLYAVDDADETVRNNATRALGVLAGYLAMHPQMKVAVPAAPFINLLHSIVWTDRNKGVFVLASLTQSRDPKVLHQLKTEALPSLIEMAKWKDRGHAQYAFVILGRIAGEKEDTLIAKNFSKDWSMHLKKIVAECKNYGAK
jgi:hypothetical protein